MTPSRSRSWLAAAALSAGVGLVAPAVLAPTAAQARQGRALVACLNLRTFNSYVFLRAPRLCVFHYAHAPFDGVHEAAIVSIRWSGWGRSVVRGHGTERGNMNFRTPATVVLSKPRRCANGTRNYTRARISTRFGGSSGPLAACRR